MGRLWEFELPTRIQFGRGGLRRLGELSTQFGRSVLLVGYRDRTGLEEAYDRAARALTGAGAQVTSFFEVTTEPDSQLPVEGARRAREAGVEVVVGLGGGSAIDTAKGIAVLARTGGNLADCLAANDKSRPICDALPLVAVPTTAGSGSEVSDVAVFTHPGAGSTAGMRLKASLFGPAIRPKVALVDPDLTVGAPPFLTAACGADALGHAIEACLSRRADPLASMLAGRAVAMIVQNLPAAVENPDDPEPREPLALAATLAGAAFTSAGVIAAHAIAQALGSLLHIPHGVAVAISTPLSLRWHAECCVSQYCQLAEYCRLWSDSPQRQAARFVDEISQLLRCVGLPDRVEVPAGAPQDLVDQLVRNAFASTPVPISLDPRRIDPSAMKQLFEELLGSGKR